MSRLVIHGNRPLKGIIPVSGRKNSAVAVIPAAVMASGPSVLGNIPDIADVRTSLQILDALGASWKWTAPHTLWIDPRPLHTQRVPAALGKRMRASYYFLGALLGRLGEAVTPVPGGDDIGQRPIDQHLKGFAALGATATVAGGDIRVGATRLEGARIYLDVVSVGATINLMLAAVLTPGVTVLENAAREPHVVDVANFLNAMGAYVTGAGTDVIKIRGVEELHGAEHAVIPDEIEAATYMIATAGTGGDVLLENVVPQHLEPVTAKLREAGCEIREEDETIRIRAEGRPRATQVKTLPYPGFPTDAQPPMTALLSVADGTSVVTETIWENRFHHAAELRRMGARIRVEERTAVVQGVERLEGADVREVSDLRSSAALVVAGLIAHGTTRIFGLEYLDRGYEALVEKLSGVGAYIERFDDDRVRLEPEDVLSDSLEGRQGA